MALDSDMVTAAVAGLSLIIGYVIGRMTSGSGSKKQTNQIILATKIKKWKIDPEYSRILVDHGKNTTKFAESELEKLSSKSRRNEQKIDAIKKDLESLLDELEQMKNEVKGKGSMAERNALLEMRFTTWMGKLQLLRTKNENAIERLLSHIYNEKFLELVVEGFKMPKLGEHMDLKQIDLEIHNPNKKNFEFMKSLIGDIDSPDNEKALEYFGIYE